MHHKIVVVPVSLPWWTCDDAILGAMGDGCHVCGREVVLILCLEDDSTLHVAGARSSYWAHEYTAGRQNFVVSTRVITSVACAI